MPEKKSRTQLEAAASPVCRVACGRHVFQVGGKIFQVGGISFQAACRFFYRPPFSAQVGGCRGGRPARGGVGRVGVWVAGRACCSVSYENPAGILTSAPKKDDFSAENAIFAENNESAGTAPRVGIRLPRTQKCYIFRYETHIYSRPLRD